MKEVTGPLLTEASKQGFAILIMAIVIIACFIIITVMWRYIVKQSEKIEELIRESIDSNNGLKNAINQLAMKI